MSGAAAAVLLNRTVTGMCGGNTDPAQDASCDNGQQLHADRTVPARDDSSPDSACCTAADLTMMWFILAVLFAFPCCGILRLKLIQPQIFKPGEYVLVRRNNNRIGSEFFAFS